MKIHLNFKHFFICLVLILGYYIFSGFEIQHKKIKKKVIDKGYVGDRHGSVNFFVVFQYEDKLIQRQDVMDDSYYHYEIGKNYIEENQELVWTR